MAAEKNHRQKLAEFIELYRNLPCLWLVKSDDYSDKHKKKLAYQQLIQSYRQYDPSGDKCAVAKKIHSMRSVYKKERARVRASLKSGAGADDIYKPSLWYYNLLTFLDDKDAVRPSRSTLDNDEEGTLQKFQTNPEIGELQQCEGSESCDPPLSVQSLRDASSPSPRRTPSPKVMRHRKGRKDLTAADEAIKLAGQMLKSLRSDDEFDTFGKYVGHKLRSFKGHQGVFARKLINDVIFAAELGKLNTDFEVVRKTASAGDQDQFHCPPKSEP